MNITFARREDGYSWQEQSTLAGGGGPDLMYVKTGIEYLGYSITEEQLSQVEQLEQGQTVTINLDPR